MIDGRFLGLVRHLPIQRAITRARSPLRCLFIVVAAVAAGTATRFALSEINVQLIFVTYYPVVLICSVLTGWRFALLATVLSAVIGQSYFAEPKFGPHFDVAAIVNLSLFITSSALIVAVGSSLRQTVRKLERATRSADLLSTELRHRVKNILTVVQALAYQSAKAPSTEEFLNSFTARLQTLATAHDLIQRSDLEICNLPEIVNEACKPFCHGPNIVQSGPACTISSRSCMPLMLLLHELCTNALKHGALSVPEGRVEISWSFATSGQQVVIEWQEIGGPSVSKQKRKGLGLSLMRAQPGIDEVHHSFEKTGACCSISIGIASDS